MRSARGPAAAGGVLQPKNWALLIGGAVVALAALFGAYTLLDSVGLAERRATATVLAKERRPPGGSHRTVLINGRPRAVPQMTGEQWLVALDIPEAADTAVASVEPALYARLHEAQPVWVRFRQGRLSGTVEVLAVEH